MSKAIRKCNSVKTVKYDVALQLNSPIERAAYLEAWLDDAPEDASGFLRALGDVARAHGMARVARDTGLGRESLYKSLCVTGNPSFATVLKIAKALGVKLHAELA